MKASTRATSIAIAALAFAMASAPALAAPKAPPTPSGAAPTLIAKFKDWTAYSMDDHNRTVCFLVSEPKSKSLSNKSASRGDPFFLVTHWSAGQALQPSIIMGYPQAGDSKTSIKIGGQTFKMFVQNDGAWMESESGDKKLTEAMRKGATMTIVGESSRGTKSTDRYSLAGVSAGLDKISDCK